MIIFYSVLHIGVFSAMVQSFEIKALCFVLYLFLINYEEKYAIEREH